MVVIMERAQFAGGEYQNQQGRILGETLSGRFDRRDERHEGD